MEPMYLTIDEAAELLRLAKPTLYNWHHRGQGPPVTKIGGRVLYNREALLAWAASRTTEPVAS